jgi:uncharacterized protein with GYD domain
MPKYLFRGRYTAGGAAGVMKVRGTGRTKAAAQLIENAGGSMDALYWPFGEDDFIVFADLPDQAAVAAVSLTVGDGAG